MIVDFEAASTRTIEDMTPAHINPIQWQQALGLARQISARVFRDGGAASDAVAAIGLKAARDVTWDKAVELIASELSKTRTAARKAAA